MCLPCRLRIRRKGYEELTGTQWAVICEAAAVRGLSVSIDIEYAWSLFITQKRKCALSGTLLVFGYKTKTTASLDRIDNSKGYVHGNVQWVHKDLNRMKWKHEQDEFIRLCVSVADYQRSLNQPPQLEAA